MEDDAEFEVTAEMLVHQDMDDEETLEEEEALESREDIDNELDNLQEEGELPIEVLLARYGYGAEPHVGDEDGSDISTEPTQETGLTSQTGKRESSQAGRGIAEQEEPSLRLVRDETPIPEAVVGQNVVVAAEAGQSVLLSPESENGQSSVSKMLCSEQTSLADGIGIHHSPDQSGPSGLSRSTLQTPYALFSAATPSDRPRGSDVCYASEEPLNVDSDRNELECSEEMIMEDRLLLKGDVTLQNDVRGWSPRGFDYTDKLDRKKELSSTEGKGERGVDEDGDEQMIIGHKRTRSRADGKSRLRSEPERRSMRLMTGEDRAMVEAYFAALMDDGSDDDEEYTPTEEWKQEIKVGLSYQAMVPERPNHTPYTPNGQEDELVWNPVGSSDKEVSKYLEAASEYVSASAERDSEMALQVLQRCKHDTRGALLKMDKDGLPRGMQPWTEDECKRFETGLRAVGKDFFLLQKQIPTRTVKELVHFYYLWKKTERYDEFIQHGRIGKKKIVCPPGHVSDFMDKYLDVHNPDSSDLHYGTTTISAEVKRDMS